MNIAIDMIPFIPGGANGGIVPLVVATMRELVASNDDSIIVLCNTANCEGLRFLEQSGISICNIDMIGLSETKETDVHQECSNDNKSTSYQIINTPVTAEIRAFDKVRKFAKKLLPNRVYGALKRHKPELKEIYGILRHPIQRLIKPAIKWIMPHGLYEWYLARKNKHLIESSLESQQFERLQEKSQMSNSRISEITGVDINLLYCPFTAIPFDDPGVPVVSVLNDIQHKYLPWFFSPEELNHRNQFYDDLVRRKPMIISISEFTRQTFLETYDFPSDNIVTIPCSVQNRLGNYAEENDDEILESLRLRDKEFILYPANFWPHKNHRGLITAFGMFLSQHPESDLRLVLTGFSSDQNKSWVEAVKRMGLSDSVLFLGYVAEAELAALYRGCRFMIFPSMFEGFGLPITEAMYMGAPVLCSNVTALPEVGGECAFYFDPYDPADICLQMEYVLEHPELVELKKELYPDHLKHFSTEEYITRIRNLFRDVLAEEKVA